MTKRYVLVEIDDPDNDGIMDAEWVMAELYQYGAYGEIFRTADVTNVFYADTSGRTDRVWYEADPSDYVLLSDQGFSPR